MNWKYQKNLAESVKQVKNPRDFTVSTITVFQIVTLKVVRQKTEFYSKSTVLRAITAGTAGNPQNVTSSINLHIEFFGRRTQLHFCKIKPRQTTNRVI